MESACSDLRGAEGEIRSLDAARLAARINRLLVSLKDSGLDLKAPCGHTNCYIAWHLPVLNNALSEAAMELTEHSPGAFTLKSMQSVDFDIMRSENSLMKAAILLYWLLKHHRCVKRLVLGAKALPVLCFPALLSEALLVNKGLVEVQAHPVDMNEIWCTIPQCSAVLAAAIEQVSLRLECLDVTPLVINHHSAEAVASGIKRGNLRHLALWGGMSRSVAKKLLDAARVCTSLSSLEITGFDRFSKSSARLLAAAVKDNKTLQKLSVRHMEENVVGIILSSLGQNDTLKELSLDVSVDSSHSTLWEGLQALRGNSGLSCVKLTDVGFRSSCAIVITDILRENKTIQELYLSMNVIGPAGSVALAKALSLNSSLRHLDVSDNNITGAEAQSFVDALAVNNTLESVRLGYIVVSEEWEPTWPRTGNVHARLHMTWNTRGLEGCAASLSEGASSSRLYIGWTAKAAPSGVVRWFSAVQEIGASLTELIIECPRRNDPVSSGAVVSFLEATKTLKKLVVCPTSSSQSSVSEIISGLARNKSVTEAEFHQYLCVDRDVKALQSLFRTNRNLHRLKFVGCLLADKAPRLLARALEDNFVFLALQFDRVSVPVNMYPLLSVLNRNRSLLNRAVKCVLGVAVDSQSVEALELLCTCDSLHDAVCEASAKTREESKRLVLDAVGRQKPSSSIPSVAGV